MAKRPPDGPSPQENPKELPSVTPRDLYPTSDIRFVMLEVGKLTANVDRLIADVKSSGDKLDGLRHQVSFVKGGIAVLVAMVAIATFLLSSKGTAILNAIKAAANSN